MDKEIAMRVMEKLDERLCWSREEFDQGVREAEAEGEEPVANPHVFSVRLDAADSSRDYERSYRVRVTPGEYEVGYADWRAVIDLAEEAKVRVVLQNSGLELS